MLSLDVFDTLLVRTVARPVDAFFLVAQQLERDGLIDDPHEFQRQRIAAERKARTTAQGAEVSLHAIYQHLVATDRYRSLDPEELATVERQVEHDLVQPVWDVINQFVVAVEPRVLVSDMYLEAKTIRQLVDRVLALAGKTAEYRLYVSSEYGVTKNSGTLYQRVAQDIPNYLASACHVGDRRYADCTVPRKLGLKAEHYAASALNREEALIADGAGATLFRSALAGCMRAARLANPFEGTHERRVWDYGCSVIAPTVILFTQWVLQSARDDGVAHLAFLARDGQIMHKVAALLGAVSARPTDCRYVYASRQAWNLPSVITVPDDFALWAFDDTDFLSVGAFAGRVGLTAAHFAEWMGDAGLGPDDNLSATDRVHLQQYVRQSERIHLAICSQARHQRELVLRYFRSVGLFDRRSWGLVDIGWRGRLQDALGRILSEGGDEFSMPRGYYFGLRNPVPSETLRKEFYGDGRRVHRSWIEHFFAADHGSVIGFNYKEDGMVAPVFNPPGAHGAAAWGVDVQHQAILKVTALLADMIKRFDIALPDNDVALMMSESLLVTAFERPSRQDAELFRSLFVYEDQLESRGYPMVVADVGWSEILTGGLLARPFEHSNEWQEASVALGTSLKQTAYQALRRVRRHAVRVLRGNPS
jgi:hypothetical protein